MNQQQRQHDIWNQPKIMKKIFNDTVIHIISNGGTYYRSVWHTRLTAMITQNHQPSFYITYL